MTLPHAHIHPPQQDPAEILPDLLYLGSCLIAKDKQALKMNNIKFIVNATAEVDNFFEMDSGFSYLKINLQDFPDERLEPHFAKTFQLIDKALAQKQAVLVHCQAGVSRSTSLVLAYLMKNANMTLKDAFQHVKMRRECIGPNEGYMKQLLEFERQLYSKTSFDLTEYYSSELIKMGFPKSKVKKALEQSSGRYRVALYYLLSTQQKKRRIS